METIEMETIEVFGIDSQRLWKIAEPLVGAMFKTGSSKLRPDLLKIATAAAFTQVLDHYEVSNGATPASTTHSTKSESLTFDATNIPNMLHTKLLKGCFDGNSPKKATWDAMVALALVSVFSSSGSVEELRRVSGANVAQGKKEADGYKHLPEQGFSYQGVSATDAVEIIRRCARAIPCNAWMEFEWRQKKGALHPGELATLNIESLVSG